MTPSPEAERHEQTPRSDAQVNPEATDFSKNDARAEALEGDAAERSSELQQEIANVSDRALELSGTLAALRPDTNVENSEVNGEFAEVSKTDFGDGASVEHVTTGDGESTLIHLSLDAEDSSTGATNETVTVKHNPTQIMIGDQLVTNIDDVNRVRQVIDQLRQEATQLPTAAEAGEQEATEQSQEAEHVEDTQTEVDVAAQDPLVEAQAAAEALATPMDARLTTEKSTQLTPEERQEQYEQTLRSAERLAA